MDAWNAFWLGCLLLCHRIQFYKGGMHIYNSETWYIQALALMLLRIFQ